ncbi:uncharacterized protein BO72DRAFT_213703 [Aspergillus fijiensis CBS 313.89]|uniref:Uncharacterized protein n=1 Tax=Aspergillus fijiensis CBS 313.89 TaxID=1448319 RepID=A0A8G1VWG1_9EURO|nr:uncharacterized protein BO72DRAFT_213703 [Aspergillus fijiensis CBS 313.89]RAK74223.1 hypothetical protein BO72DRAFT_213703 [Aspergillus fijiensis CBS 313.89]
MADASLPLPAQRLFFSTSPLLFLSHHNICRCVTRDIPIVARAYKSEGFQSLTDNRLERRCDHFPAAITDHRDLHCQFAEAQQPQQ